MTKKEEGLTAQEMAKEMRAVSVSEFFEKNRHLLGYDNLNKALLTVVKEGVDNSLDASEEAGILPEIKVDIKQSAETRFKITIEDNGPGIIKEKIPNVFASLLYGSKFHRIRQSLTGDQPIIFKENGKIKVEEIGSFIDKYVKVEGDFACSNGGLEVPAFDWKNYKYSFKPVSHLIKHKRENEIYSIKTVYGREIKVTGGHSLFTINKKDLTVKEAEARKLRKGDVILAPKKLWLQETIKEINILDYINEEDIKKRFWYLYLDKKIVREVFLKAEVIHKKKLGDKSRRFYRLKSGSREIDILDDSYKQYIKKGFLPLWLAKSLNLLVEGTIKTYHHGKEYTIPTIWPINRNFMSFLGLYTAEGHSSNRQLALTFSITERNLIRAVADFCLDYKINFFVNERPESNSMRITLNNSVLSYLIKKWCGIGAKRKKVPDFVFVVQQELRQDYLDYLYRGDGHKPPTRNALTMGITSRQLANDTIYLWLLQGVAATYFETYKKGLSKKPVLTHIVNVYGGDINFSNYYTSNSKIRRRNSDPNLRMISNLLGKGYSQELINYFVYLKQLKGEGNYRAHEIGSIFNKENVGYKIRFLKDIGFFLENKDGTIQLTKKCASFCEEIGKLKRLIESDFLFLPIKEVKRITGGYDYVYDLSVPECENFVGGLGGIACHNSRGIQGIGISSAVLYSQLTTGKSTKIYSKISSKKKTHHYELHINTKNNQPQIVKDEEVDWNKEHGVKIELEIEAKFIKGRQSVDEYIKQTAIVNPHATIIYTNPLGEKFNYKRVVDKLPVKPKEIKPHPYGVELGALIRMLRDTKAKTIQSFLTNEFSRVSSELAKKICESAKIYINAKPSEVAAKEAETLYKTIQATKIMAPPTNCLSPLGEEALIKGLQKEVKAEFYASTSRPPSVYRGFPFLIECALAYGGELPQEELARLMRFANRVPLLYQQSACAITKASVSTAWKNYNISQSKGALPAAPLVIMVHIASVWVPFTSEAKEAVASYPEIMKDIKLALQDCGRKLNSYIRKTVHVREQKEKAGLFEKYIPELANALNVLTGESKNRLIEELNKKLKKELPLILAGGSGEPEIKMKAKPKKETQAKLE